MASSAWMIYVRFPLVFFAITLGAVGQLLAATADTNKSEAERLVAAATQAEIGGNIPEAIASMQDAVRTNPGNQLARWRTGQMRVDGEWTSVDEAQRRASADRRQTQYRELRKTASDTVEDQIALAKWCLKYHLNDEARFHWANVLKINPQHADALRALDLHRYKGRLLTSAEFTALRNGPSAQLREHFAASLTKWRRALVGKAFVTWDDSLAEIRSIKSVEAIPAIEELIVQPDLPDKSGFVVQKSEPREDVSLAFLAALAPMPEQEATEALMRQAAWSPFANIRDQATDELKKRPLYNYVPMLLDGMALPIQSSYTVDADGDGTVRYVHKFFRPGETTDYSDVRTHEAKIDPAKLPFSRPRFALWERQPEVDPSIVSMLALGKEVMLNCAAASTEVKVANENNASAVRNGRISEVLAKTTGQNFGDDPRKWWDYWHQQNEYYVPDQHPVYQQYHDSNEKYGMSCFAKGTPIWTKLGRRPVQSLEVGDLVLSQNVDTGELKYEPVIGRTVRPPSAILKVTTDGDQIMATKGHPFWVAGVGWRMAKELEDGAVLCGLNRAARVRSIEAAGEAEAYNLVVADQNTYFVGTSGLLVHDNTPRRPTRATVPGVIAAK